MTNQNLRVNYQVDQIVSVEIVERLGVHDAPDPRSYQDYRGTKTVTEDTLTTLPVDRAKIVAGRNLNVNLGGGTNYVSDIITGGAEVFTSPSISNTQPTLYKKTTESGIATLNTYSEAKNVLDVVWKVYYQQDKYSYSLPRLIQTIPVTKTYQTVTIDIPSQTQAVVTGATTNKPSTTTKTASSILIFNKFLYM